MEVKLSRPEGATLSSSLESHYFSLLLSWYVSYFLLQTGLAFLTKFHMAYNGQCSSKSRCLDALFQTGMENSDWSLVIHCHVVLGFSSFLVICFSQSWLGSSVHHTMLAWGVPNKGEDVGNCLLKWLTIFF